MAEGARCQCVDWRAALLFSDPAACFGQSSRLSHKNLNCAFTAHHTMSAITSGIRSSHSLLCQTQTNGKKKGASAAQGKAEPRYFYDTTTLLFAALVSCQLCLCGFNIPSMWFHLFCNFNRSAWITLKKMILCVTLQVFLMLPRLTTHHMYHFSCPVSDTWARLSCCHAV